MISLKAFRGEHNNYYIIYQTTNLINGRFYIGMHQTKDLKKDMYLGTGQIITDAIFKYGGKNFKRDIICFCESRKELSYFEANFVTQEFIDIWKGIIYNIYPGGGNPNYRKPDSKETKLKKSNSQKNRIVIYNGEKDVYKKVSVDDYESKYKKKNWIRKGKPKTKELIDTQQGSRRKTCEDRGYWYNEISKAKMRDSRGNRTPDSLETKLRKSIARKEVLNREGYVSPFVEYNKTHKGVNHCRYGLHETIETIETIETKEKRNKTWEIKLENGYVGPRLNINHKLESKNLISIKNSNRIGIVNLNLQKERKVIPKELEEYLQQGNGWVIGRLPQNTGKGKPKKKGKVKIYHTILCIEKFVEPNDLEGYLQQDNCWKIGRNPKTIKRISETKINV